MKVHDYFLNSIDWWMIFCWRSKIATIQIYSIGVYPIMASSYSIRVENREQIKNKIISKDFGLLRIFNQLFDDPCHYMRTWDLTWMNSCPDNNSFLLRTKKAWFFCSFKQMFILDFFFFIGFELVRGDNNKLYWPSF